MKRISLRTLTILFAFAIGVFLNTIVKLYVVNSDFNSEVLVESDDNEYFYRGMTWQDEESFCGKPRKSLFNDEYIIIDNPLCRYSFDLREVPTIDYDELSKFPKFYDRKIIRVKGRFYMNPKAEYPHESRFYLMSEKLSVEMPIEFNGPWDFDITTKLRNFIESNSPETNSAEVSLIIEFLDVSNNADVLAISNNNPLQMLLLNVEKMKAVFPNSKKK